MQDYLLTAVGVLGVLLILAIVTLEVGWRVAALGIVPGGRKPSTGMAWLLLVLLAPLLGGLLFWLFGSTRLGRMRDERHRAVNARIAARTRQLPRPLDSLDAPSYVASVARLNRRLGAFPVTEGNRAELVSDYDQALRAMASAVDRARESVHAQFHVLAWDARSDVVLASLARAAERGVDVRLLFDHLGSRRVRGYSTTRRRLRATSIQWRPALPVQPLRRRPDLRNHRKLLVVDGAVAFTGSQNLTEPGYHQSRNHRPGRERVELVVRVEGPAVASLAAVFAGDWYVETGEELGVVAPPMVPEHRPGTGVLAQVLPSGPGFATENSLRMVTTLVYGARRRLSIVSPSFVPDESLLYAVTTAAQRGVDVELFVSEAPDHLMAARAGASYYAELLDAGVRIYRYPAPLVLHAEHLSVDDDVAVVGTGSMDLRSFTLHHEVSLMLVGEQAVRDVRAVEDAYRATSHALLADEWSARSRRARYVDNVMRLTAALQ